jgi:hypothetical protein
MHGMIREMFNLDGKLKERNKQEYLGRYRIIILVFVCGFDSPEPLYFTVGNSLISKVAIRSPRKIFSTELSRK